MGCQAYRIQTVLVKGNAVGFLHNVQSTLYKLQESIGCIAIHGNRHQVQGDIPRLIFRQLHTAAILDNFQGTPPQLILLLIEQLRFVQQQIRQGDAFFQWQS